MKWKDLFKDYPDEMVLGAMLGIIENLKVLLLFGEFMDKDKLIKTMEKTLKSVEKDLKEFKDEKNIV